METYLAEEFVAQVANPDSVLAHAPPHTDLRIRLGFVPPTLLEHVIECSGWVVLAMYSQPFIDMLDVVYEVCKALPPF